MKSNTCLSAALLVALVLATGCKASFNVDGFKFADSSTALDVPVGEDTADVGRDTRDSAQPQDTIQLPPSCNRAWTCMLESTCTFLAGGELNTCSHKCSDDLNQEDKELFIELITCVADSCQSSTSSDRAGCAWEYCAPRWTRCVGAGGEEICGDMHSCLEKKCRSKAFEPGCVHDCINRGSTETQKQLADIARCSDTDSGTKADSCVEGLVACYLGSGDQNMGCADVLNCQYDCYHEHCRLALDPSEMNCQQDDLYQCSVECLRNLEQIDADQMIAMEKCMFLKTHQNLEGDGVNLYSYCLKDAIPCFNNSGSGKDCRTSTDCLAEGYDFFDDSGLLSSRSFPRAVECINTTSAAEREGLSRVATCLAQKYGDFLNNIFDNTSFTLCRARCTN